MILTQEITSIETSPHETTSTSCSNEQGPPTQHCSESVQSKDGEANIKEVESSHLQFQQQSSSKHPYIFTGEDETIIFHDIDDDPWRYFISSLDDIDDENDEAYEASFLHNDNDEDESCWVEFEHEEESPWDKNEEDNNMTNPYADSSSDLHDTDVTEIDLPLSHFQSLPIDRFTPTTTTNHPHPLPKITPNPTTNTITITYNTETNYDCTGFQLARYVAQMANVPLPLSRRVHELQGCIGEDRKGSREWRTHRREWLEGWGSPLFESWVLVGEDEIDEDSVEEIGEHWEEQAGNEEEERGDDEDEQNGTDAD